MSQLGRAAALPGMRRRACAGRPPGSVPTRWPPSCSWSPARSVSGSCWFPGDRWPIRVRSGRGWRFIPPVGGSTGMLRALSRRPRELSSGHHWPCSGCAVGGGALVVLGLAMMAPINHRPLGGAALLVSLLSMAGGLWVVVNARTVFEVGVFGLFAPGGGRLVPVPAARGLLGMRRFLEGPVHRLTPRRSANRRPATSTAASEQAQQVVPARLQHVRVRPPPTPDRAPPRRNWECTLACGGAGARRHPATSWLTSRRSAAAARQPAATSAPSVRFGQRIPPRSMSDAACTRRRRSRVPGGQQRRGLLRA